MDKKGMLSQKNAGVSVPFLLLGVFSLFVFLDNHNALFISDYYLMLSILICYGFAWVLCGRTVYMSREATALICAAIYLVGVSFANYREVDRGTLLSYLLWFLSFFFLAILPSDKKSIDFVIACYMVGACIAALLVLIFRHPYGDTGRFSILIPGNTEDVDPNYLGGFLFTAIALGLFVIPKKTSQRILFVLFEFVILGGLALTGSRAAYLSVFIVFAGFLLQILRGKQKKYFWIALLVFLVAGGIVFAVLPEEFRQRFSICSLFDTSNQYRLEHWGAALHAFSLKPIFGYGAAHTKTILSDYSGHVSDAHSTWLTFMLHFGTVGMILLGYVFWKIVRPIFKSKNILAIAFLLAFFINNFIIANHLGISFWLPLMLLYCMQFHPGYFGENPKEQAVAGYEE